MESPVRLYMQIRVITAPTAVALYGFNGWLIAQERIRTVLLLQLLLNGLNILLDIWFVMVFGWGSAGVAWASFFSEISALLFGMLLSRDIWLAREEEGRCKV